MIAALGVTGVEDRMQLKIRGIEVFVYKSCICEATQHYLWMILVQ